MNKIKKKSYTVFLTVVAACFAVAALLTLVFNFAPARAYDEVGPSFLDEKSHTYRLESDFAISNNTVSGLSATALATVGQYDTITLEIPSGVTAIAKDAFNNEDNYGRRVVKVVIPDSVTTIGEKAFTACQKMMHLTLGSNVSSIGSLAFSYCYKLVEIYNRSKLSLTIGSENYGRIAQLALNIYTPTSGSSMLAKTDDNYYFCKYTSSTTRVLATQSGSSINYEQGKWYLVAGAHINGKENSLPDPNGGSFTVKYEIKDGYDSISSYDISQRAFWMSYATKLVIPSCVNVIGDTAFGFSFFYKAVINNGGSGTLYIGKQAFYLYSSITIQEGNSQYFDPEIGQASRIGQEVYLPERDISCATDSFYAPLSDNTATIYSAIVYPSRALYNSKKSQINAGAANVTSSENSSVAINNYITYPIDINYRVYDKTNNVIETYTEQRLYRANGKWGYNYAETVYGYRASSKYTTLPNIGDLDTVGEYRYTATKWYQSISNSGFGTPITIDYINTQLANSNTTSVELCMKYIERPDLETINAEWDYTGESFDSQDAIDGLLVGTPLANTLGWHVNYVITRNGEEVDAIKDVGVYTLTLIPDESFSAYGTWDENPTVTFTINKAKIELTDPDNFRFVDNAGNLLQSGTVYIYNEESGRVPYAAQQDGKDLASSTTVMWAYTRNRAGLSIKVNDEDIPRNAVTNEVSYGVGSYSTTPSVNGVGIYNTSVIITPTDNYEFTYGGFSEDIQKRGLNFGKNDDGSYTITKTWYVIAISNWFVVDENGESSESYKTENFRYNDAAIFGAPYLAHGDRTLVTFDLSSNNGEIEFDGISIAAFTDYINSSMPIGRYILTLHAGEYTDEADGGTVYPEFSTSYEFTVAASTALIDDHAETINNALRGVRFGYEYDGNYHLYDDKAEAAINGVLETQINDRKGVWVGSEFDGYYSDGFSVSYNITSMPNNGYYSETELGAYAPVDPATYTVYYQVSAQNYEDLVNVSDDSGRRSYYFTVFVYDYVEVPYAEIARQANSLVYTGSIVRPVISANDLYSVGWDIDKNYITAGEYEVIFDMRDSEHYLWKLPEASGDVTQEMIDKNVHLDSENGVVTVKFVIKKAENTWNSTPNVISWAWSGFVAETNAIRAVPRYNLYTHDGDYANVKVEYIIFYADKTIAVEAFETENGVVTDPSVIEKIKSLGAGRYYLMAFAEETENFLGINVEGDTKIFNDDAYVEFYIAQAVNRWSVTPNIIRWTWDRFNVADNIILATPEFGGKVNYYIYKVDENGEKVFLTFGEADGEDIISFNTDENGVVPDNVAKVLSALDAGTYYLISNVPSTANYTGLYEIEERVGEDGERVTVYPEGMNFAIFKASNRWEKSPSVSGWMWNSFSSDEVTVVAEPAYKTKADGSAVGITFVLYGTYNGANADNNVAITRAFELDGGKLPETFLLADGTEVNVAEYLNGLSRGNYYLVASVEDGGNFEALSDSAVVTVSVLSNGWVYTPSINGWEWGAFDVEKNTVTSTPMFNGKEFFAENIGYACNEVTYYLYQDADGVKVKVQGFENGFKADENGKMILTDAEIKVLNELAAGRYYLLAVVAADENGNYTGINAASDNLDYIAFNIAQAVNYWETSPSMTGWQYGLFTTDSNFVAGVPHYGEASAVKYTLYDAAEAILKEFTDINDVKDYLVGCKTGSYKLVAELVGTDDYTTLYLPVPFNISPNTNNSWIVIPSITGWVYGDSSDANVTEGKATFGEVKYTVATRNGSVYESVAGFVDLTGEELKAKLSKLDAGSYSLTIVSAQELEDGQIADYVAAERTLYFEVEKAENSWATVPSLDSWTWGDTANVPDDGKTTAESVIVGEYYKANTDGTLGEKLNGAPTAAGYYAYYVTAEESANYKALYHTVYFEIKQYRNDWVIKPEGTLSWTWGDTVSDSWDIVRASAEKGEIVFTITGKDFDGYSIEPVITDIDGIEAALQALGAGTYNVAATVAGSVETYGGLDATTSVAVSKANLSWKTEPIDSSWTWDDANIALFATPEVNTVIDGDAPEITFNVGIKGDTATTHYEDYASMAAAVRLLGAGTYEITVNASCKNYNSIGKTVELVIGRADFVWVTEPQDAKWSWNGNWTESDGGRDIVEPQAKDAKGSVADIKFTVGARDFASFAELEAYLQSKDLDAGTYTVVVTVERANYNTVTTSFDVVISAAENSWIVEPKTTIIKEYRSDLTADDIADNINAAAKFGTVEFSGAYDGTQDLLEWVNGLSAGTYNFTTLVNGNNNYGALSVNVTVTVKGIGAAWDNENKLVNSYAFTYGSDLTELMSSVVIPVKTPSSENDEISYRVLYTPFIGEAAYPSIVPQDGQTMAQAIEAWLTSSSRGAGVYKITANYTPDDPSYAKLDYEITISVARAKIEWSYGTQPDSNYSEPYQGFGSVLTPTAGEGHNVTYTITGSKNETLTNVVLADYLNGLSIGSYTITYGVEETNNYTGLSNVTFNVSIYKASNEWLDQSVLQKEWTVYRGGEFGFEIPKARYGTVVCVVTDLAGRKYTPVGDINEWFDSQNFAASDTSYGISFSVDGTDNYNGLIYECSLYIRKNANAWVTASKSDYVWQGAAEEFTFPEAQYYNELMRFDIVKAGDASYSRTGLTKDELLSELNALRYGTYTVTMRIGGEGNASDPDKSDIDTYNSDYEYLASVSTILFERGGNAFTVELSDKRITFGDTVEIDKPVASNGNDAIVYSIVGTKLNGDAVSYSFDTARDSEAFAKLLTQLNKLDAGVYTVSANIAVSDTYEAAVTSAVYTVDKVTTAWTVGDDELDKYKTNLSAAYNAVPENILPVLRLSNWANGKIVLSVNGVELKDDPSTSSINEGSWVYALNNGDAGVYRVTAYVAGDDNHTDLIFETTVVINPITTEWENQAELDGNRTLTWVWGNPDGIELPTPIASWGNGNIKYYITENGVKSAIVGEDSDWNTVLVGKSVGTYYLSAEIDGDGNHTDLTYEITVTIQVVDTAWTDEVAAKDNASYSWTYDPDKGYSDMPVKPVLANWAGGVVTYTLTKSGTSGSLDSGNDWDKIIATLTAQSAGTYIITASVAGDVNHASLTHIQTVVIVHAANDWVKHVGENASVTWIYGDSNDEIAYEAAFNNDKLVILINNVAWSPSAEYATLNAYLCSRGVGTYTISVSVAADSMYEGLSEIITLTVSLAPNSWATEMTVGSDGVTAADGSVAVKGWTWSNREVKDGIFGAPVPAVGNEVNISVSRISGSLVETVISATIRIENGGIVNANDLTAFLTRLFALDAGEYKISASVPSNGNYKELADSEEYFEIKKAKNEWVKEPTVGTLTFGSNAPNPESQAKFGSVEKYMFAYATDADGNVIEYEDAVWEDSAPIVAGEYYVRGEVAGTVNYTGLSGYGKYEIGSGANTWVNMPGVIAWAWNGYDKTVNIFSGSARNNGEATFGIRKGAVDNMTTLDVNDFIAFENVTITSEQVDLLNKFTLETVKLGDSEVKYVSDEISKVLNALRPGTYILVVDIAGGDSYTALSGTATFVVGYASNEWKTTTELGAVNTLAPNVLSFVYGNADSSFTEGVAKFGVNNVRYRVTGTDFDGNTVRSDDEATDIKGLNAAAIKAFIEKLDAGNYYLQAWVNGGATYDAFYSDSAPYSVMFGVLRAENDWITAPTVSISVAYNDLHSDGVTSESIFAEPQAKTAVKYFILNSDGDQIVVGGTDGIEYKDVFGELLKLDYGSYIIRSSAVQSCNYTSISANTTLTISSLANALKYTDGDAFVPTTVYGSWNDGDNDISSFKEVVASHGDVVYTYGGKAYTFAAVKEYLKTADAGTYNIVLSVDATGGYGGIDNLTYTLIIAPAENAWIDGWTVINSIIVGSNRDFAPSVSWEWSTQVTWNGAKTVYGTTVYVMITSVDGDGKESDALHYFTIDTATNFDAQVSNVSSALSALGAGDYYLTVTAPNATNWSAIDSNTKAAFSVVKTETNKWLDSDGKAQQYPVLVDGAGNSVTEWGYGTSVRAQANSAYGTWQVEYYAYDGNVKGTHYASMPTDAGSYIAVFNVGATANYNELDHEIPFTINRILYESYAVVPGVVSWTWNEYDRYINLFKGSALSGGAVSFTILQNDKVVEIDGVKLENIELVDGNGIHHTDEQSQSLNVYVPEQYSDLIAKLLAGDYTLRVDFAQTTNFKDFHPTVDFNVALAHNEWTVVPNVSPWVVNNWTENSTPQAQALYGNPTIVITNMHGATEYYKAQYDIELGEYVVYNNLNHAGAGWYTLYATVDAEVGKYDKLPDVSYDFQIFIQGSLDEKNNWVVMPSVKPWLANTDNLYGEIVGAPIRGLAYFEFYTAVRENGVLTVGELITAGEDSVLVEAGNTYYKDFYVPMAPGQYYLIAKAVYEVDGKPVDADTIESSPLLFEIGNRANTFTQDARISTVLYLGEKDSWQAPSAFASLPDSEVTFTYYDAETKAELGSEIPTVPGNYILRATAFARYSEPIVSEIEFTVALSQNSWVGDKSPTISDWSEEFSDTAPDPVGAAKYGTIVYTYVNVLAPDEILTEKPLTAGTYVMYATVELDGYVTLESSYQFTIEAAYDSTLMLIDMILGLVACAFAVVVIIFAIRRYKENG